MKKLCFLFLCILISSSVFAKKKKLKLSPDSLKAQVERNLISPALAQKEKELMVLFDKMLGKDSADNTIITVNDSSRLAINTEIRRTLNAALKLKGSYFYRFDSLPNLGKIYSDDYNIRVYTWACEMQDSTYRFYGFIQDFDTETIYPLTQNKRAFLPPDNVPIKLNRWYGALYYKAINVGSKKNPKYILLGWTQPSAQVKAKIMEVLDIDDNGRAILGELIFKGYNGKAYRNVFAYCADLSFTLNYDAKGKRFIFDHLVQITEEKGTDQYGNPIYETRPCKGPDMSYDSLKKKARRWVLQTDVDMRNEF
jgi:hypothetical protein